MEIETFGMVHEPYKMIIGGKSDIRVDEVDWFKDVVADILNLNLFVQSIRTNERANQPTKQSPL